LRHAAPQQWASARPAARLKNGLLRIVEIGFALHETIARNGAALWFQQGS